MYRPDWGLHPGPPNTSQSWIHNQLSYIYSYQFTDDRPSPVPIHPSFSKSSSSNTHKTLLPPPWVCFLLHQNFKRWAEENELARPEMVVEHRTPKYNTIACRLMLYRLNLLVTDNWVKWPSKVPLQYTIYGHGVPRFLIPSYGCPQ